MATENNITDKNTLKKWFKRGLKPLQAQFWAWMDSYWHKSEAIPVSSIEDLETILNKKAETVEVKEIADGLEEHIKDDTRHKTPEEQSQLDHLAADPDATYARKDELPETVRLYATGTVAGDNVKYTMDAESIAIVKEAAKNVTPLTGALLSCTFTTENSAIIERTFVCIQSRHQTNTNLSRQMEVLFMRMENRIFYRLAFTATRMPSGTITFSGSGIETQVEIGEYIKSRYASFNSGTYDLNDMQQTGGIMLNKTETNTIANLPEGLTMVTGYVLASDFGCTQVLTDITTDKTYTRRYGVIVGDTPTTGWTPWVKVSTGKPDPLILTATYTENAAGNRAYTLAAGQVPAIYEYLQTNRSAPVLLKVTDPANTYCTTYIAANIQDRIGRSTNFFFYDIEAPASYSVSIYRLCLQFIYLSSGSGMASLYENSANVTDSEYKYDRYQPEESFDMNNWIETGGITAWTDETITGANLPAGFTDITGCVLQNLGAGNRNRCCIQIITDSILKKTMYRAGIPSEDYRGCDWTPWAELGGGLPSVYLVADYPADLTPYPEGTIFIKE